jgi:WD40 repeat protein
MGGFNRQQEITIRQTFWIRTGCNSDDDDEIQINRNHSPTMSTPHCRLLCSYFAAVALPTCALPLALAQTPDFHTYIRRVAFSPDGRQSVDLNLVLRDLPTGKEIRKLDGHKFQVYAVAFSMDGRRIISGDGSDIRIWDARSGKLIQRLDGRNGNVSSLAVSPDGRHAVSGHGEGSGIQLNPARDLYLWDLNKGEVVEREALQGDVVFTQAVLLPAFRVLPDKWKDRLPSPTYYRLRAPLYRETIRFEGQEHVNAVAFSPDSKRVICGRADGTARILDIGLGRELAILRGHEKDIWSVAFSPDARTSLTAGEDGTVRLWRLPSALTILLPAKEERCFEGHKGAVYSAAFSKDGRRAVSGGDDKTVRVWDVCSGKELARFNAKDPITSVTFVGDQHVVAGATIDERDGRIQIWKMND